MLNMFETQTLVAAMEQILPACDGPGATEANVIAYVEWLAGQPRFQSHSRCLSNGLELVESLARAMWNTSFSSCDANQRNAVLQRVHDTPHATVQRFFVMLVRITLAGFLCPPEYGGNRDGVGWDHIGYQPDEAADRAAFAPPAQSGARP